MSEWVLAQSDYDRAELVMLAWVSKDPNMMAALQAGEDLHAKTGQKIAELSKVKYEGELPSWLRDLGKTINFATVYGQTPETTASKLGITLQEAFSYHAAYDQEYPMVKEYFNAVERTIREMGEVRTLFGRRRTCVLYGDYRDNHTMLDLKNFTIQSPTADITLCKLNEISRWIREMRIEKWIRPINIVYDAIWFQILKKEIHLLDIVKNKMEDMSTLPIKFGLPLRCSTKWAKSLYVPKDT